MYKGPLDVQSLPALPCQIPFCFHFLLFLLHSCNFTRSGGGSWWNNAHFFPPWEAFSSIRWEKKAYSWVQGEGKSRARRLWRGHERVSKERQEKSQWQRWLLLQRTGVTLLTQWEEGRAGDKCSGASSQRQENLCLHTSACFCRARRKQQSQQTLPWASISQPLVKEAKGGTQNDDAWAWLMFEHRNYKSGIKLQ